MVLGLNLFDSASVLYFIFYSAFWLSYHLNCYNVINWQSIN